MYSNVEMFVNSDKRINLAGAHAQLGNNWFYFPEELREMIAKSSFQLQMKLADENNENILSKIRMSSSPA